MKKDYLEPEVKVVELEPEACCFEASSIVPDEDPAKEMFFDLEEDDLF